MKIALLGSRGIPARYGGYETFLEELAARLVLAGHEVTVYCRSHYTRRDERQHRGARLVVLPTLATKHLDTPVHTLLSTLHAFFRDYDVALVVNAANAIFVPILRLGRIKTALHVDGIEKRRAKWGRFGRLVYALSEHLACRVTPFLVTDAEVIARHYRERYGAESTMIAYGALPAPPAQSDVLTRLGLEQRRYFLYVSRFEPENNPLAVIDAYAQVGGEMKLVMVGSAPYSDQLIATMKARAEKDRRVLLPGAIYGDGYRELQSQAFAYIHATEVGGTHPALVEAMGYGNCPVVNDTPENREVAGEDARYFVAARPETLTRVMEELRQDPKQVVDRGRLAAARAQARYSWAEVTNAYLRLFASMKTG